MGWPIVHEGRVKDIVWRQYPSNKNCYVVYMDNKFLGEVVLQPTLTPTWKVICHSNQGNIWIADGFTTHYHAVKHLLRTEGYYTRKP